MAWPFDTLFTPTGFGTYSGGGGDSLEGSSWNDRIGSSLAMKSAGGMLNRANPLVAAIQAQYDVGKKDINASFEDLFKRISLGNEVRGLGMDRAALERLIPAQSRRTLALEKLNADKMMALASILRSNPGFMKLLSSAFGYNPINPGMLQLAEMNQRALYPYTVAGQQDRELTALEALKPYLL